jgi:hypothetical protein
MNACLHPYSGFQIGKPQILVGAKHGRHYSNFLLSKPQIFVGAKHGRQKFDA